MNDPVHVAKSFEVNGQWARWSRYDLLNGVVVPAKNAKLERYDPWQQFRSSAGKYRTVEQPYVALLELHRKLKQAESNGIQPSQLHSRYFLGEPLIGPKNEADDLILAWCNRHGLLGLVSVLSNSIRPSTLASIEDGVSTAVSTHHLRDGGVWIPLVQHVRTYSFFLGSEQADHVRQAAANHDLPHPGVTWFDWTTRIYEEKPLKEIRDFFLPTAFGSAADVQEEVPIPCPNSRQFWDVYGEPVWQFTRWCQTFTEAVDLISGWDKRGEAFAVSRAHFALSGLAEAAAPSFRFNAERNTVDEERVSAGLLASYALMFLWDRMERRRALSCGNCSRYFVSNERQARYCSPRCRNTAQVRRSREKVSREVNGGK